MHTMAISLEGNSVALKCLEEEVKCPLCLEIFTEPKKLSCDHVVCRQCLGNLIQRSTDGTLTCPVCRTTSLQVFGTSQFPTAYQVNRLIDIYKKTLQEQSQDTLTAAATEQPQLPICSLHTSQPLALYCETCELTVCRDCVIVSCSTMKHSYGFIKDIAEKYKAETAKETLPIQKLQQNIAGALVAIKEDDEKLRKQKAEEQGKAEVVFEVLLSNLKQQKDRITLEIGESFTKQSSNNTLKRKELENVLANLTTAVGLAAESINLEQDFTSEIKKVTAQKKSLQDLYHHFKSTCLQPTRFSGVDTTIELIPRSFNPCHYLFHVEKDYRCHLDQYEMLKSLQLNQPFQIKFHLTDLSNEAKIKSNLVCVSDNSSVPTKITKLPHNAIRLSFTPQKRGRHELRIHHDDIHICGSPIPSLVYLELQQIASFGKPRQFSFDNAAGIKCYGDKVYVTSFGEEIVVLEHVKQNLVVLERISLPGVNEVLVHSNSLYYTDILQHRLVKAQLNGRILASTGGRGSLPGYFNYPNGIAISRNNEMFVCDTSNGRIQVYDVNLNMLRVIGEAGDAPGQFRDPCDLVFDEDGNIYVVEYESHRVQVLTPQGEHVQFIGSSDVDGLVNPISAEIYNRHICVTNTNSIGNRIFVYTLTGEFVTSFGENDAYNTPECIAIDSSGLIYVTCNRKRLLQYLDFSKRI